MHWTTFQRPASRFWERIWERKHCSEREISGSHGNEYEDYDFWDVVPCTVVETDRRSRDATTLVTDELKGIWKETVEA